MTVKQHVKIDTTINYQNVHPIDRDLSVITDCTFIQDNDNTTLVMNANVHYIDKVITLATCNFKIRNDVDYLITNSIGALSVANNIIDNLIKVNQVFENKSFTHPRYLLASNYIIAINGAGNHVEYCGVFNTRDFNFKTWKVVPMSDYDKYGLNDLINAYTTIPMDADPLNKIVGELTAFGTFINNTILPKINSLKQD